MSTNSVNAKTAVVSQTTAAADAVAGILTASGQVVGAFPHGATYWTQTAEIRTVFKFFIVKVCQHLEFSLQALLFDFRPQCMSA